MGRRWKLFERYVAAIEQVDHPGAVVTWDETIEGHQFDVSIRWKQGRYDFLVVIECRDRSSRVKRREVSALAQEASSVRANKAVLVSRSGFQSGCFDKARETGVVLVRLEEFHEIPPRWRETVLAVWLYDIRLVDGDGQVLRSLTDEEAHAAVVSGPIGSRPLGDVLSRDLHRRGIDRTVERQPHVRARVALPKGSSVSHGIWSVEPDAVELTATLAPANLPRRGFDPAILGRSLRVTHELTGETRTYSLWDLEPGVDTEFRVGEFFIEVATGNEVLCEAVDDDLATLFVVRSRQFGKDRLFGPFNVDISANRRRYVRIEDKNLVAELRARALKVERPVIW